MNEKQMRRNKNPLAFQHFSETIGDKFGLWLLLQPS